MIGYLKQNKFGRATFLPLTSMHGGGGIRQQEALKEPGVTGLASSAGQVEDRFMGLAEQLLGRTIVVVTLIMESDWPENTNNRSGLSLWKENS